MSPEDIRAIKRVAREAREYESIARTARRIHDELPPGLRLARTLGSAEQAKAMADIVAQRIGLPSPETQHAMEQWARPFGRRPPKLPQELLGGALTAEAAAAAQRRIRELIEVQRLAGAVDLERFRNLRLDTAASAHRFGWSRVEVRFFAFGTDEKVVGFHSEQFGETFLRHREGAARSFAQTILDGYATAATWSDAAIPFPFDRAFEVEKKLRDLKRQMRTRASEAPPTAARPVVVVDDRRDSRFTEETESGIAIPAEQPIAAERQPATPNRLHVVEGGPEARVAAMIEADIASRNEIMAALKEIAATSRASLDANKHFHAQVLQRLDALIGLGYLVYERLPSKRSSLLVPLITGFALVLVQIYYPADLRPASGEEKTHETRPAPRPQPPAPLHLPREARPANGQLDGAGREVPRAA